MIEFDPNIHDEILYDGERVGFKLKYNPDTDLKISVSGVNSREVISVGSSATINVSIVDGNGAVKPITEAFAVPVRRIGGAVERTIGISFTDGTASKTINWPTSGEFEITEDLINMHLPDDQHFKFDRLVFSVYE